jgi:predicted anti-sigma-YlaC factor YlaD
MDGNCRSILGALCDSIDGEVEGEMCRQLEHHLARCPKCRVVLDSTRRTVLIYRGETAPCIPPAFGSHLHALLKACWHSNVRPKIA